MKPGTVWVSILSPERAVGPEATLYESENVPKIARALSLVPDRVRVRLHHERVFLLNVCTRHAAPCVSGQMTGTEVDMKTVNGDVQGDTGGAHAAELVAFFEAIMGDDEHVLVVARAELLNVVSPAGCALIGAFSVVDRIANWT